MKMTLWIGVMMAKRRIKTNAKSSHVMKFNLEVLFEALPQKFKEQVMSKLGGHEARNMV